ncbi:MAG: M48 family metallopeptidase [Albidovulum sp.]|jgi:predicted Zn-dependent protease|uniref:M48 family metallopeptidase n=3 Tax=Albidovulum sp. TaxID=1872424 RepID=UPI003032198E
MRQVMLAALALALAGCVETSAPPPVQMAPLPEAGSPVSPGTAAANFVGVVRRMEPVIEQECLARRARTNCDFRIVVDDRPGQPPNAYQTLDSAGRPIIAFTLPLIAEARNADELAFVMGHEAAHHIASHIPRQQQEATTGALILGVLTAATGGDETAIRTAQNLGGTIGARRYAKDYELEADALGTILAWDAGYDPERGAAFFARIPDPGNRFLGTHPPNAARIDTVRRTLASLQ